QLPEEVNQLVVGDPGIVANWGLAAAGLVFVVVVVAGVLLAEYAKEQVQKKEQENQKQLEQQMEGREVQQQQEAQQQERGEAHAEQQERQAEGQQERQAEGQQERQAEGQQQGEGQQEHQANSGNLNWFVDEAELVSEIEGLTAGAAIQTLVELRTNLMIQVSCGDPRVGRDCTRAPPRSTSGRGDRSGWRGRGLPAVSAWTISLGALFGAMLVVTATAQFRRFRWAQWLKGHDACAYIPAWTFFAPNPGVNDTRVLWREQLLDGTIGPWHEMVGPQGGLLRAVWNPTKRARKAVTDCGPMAVRMIARNQRSALPIMGLPYLMIVQHMAGRHGSPLGLARQFTVVNTQGADTEDDGLFQLLFVSQWHRQPGVAQDTPLRAPLLPEVPDLAERVAQGKPSAQPEDTRAEHEEGASERVVESEVA
ncbi:MAG TPA: hypothetical protein VK672_04825, partial [Solirubrobacteraceae bacterium]|nr:hypothetical protein [Solirubrobacteraceae bacterium]